MEVPAALHMDLSKDFYAMPHDILVSKLYAYGMSQETVTLLASYLRNRKQRVKVGNCKSDWGPLSKGVPQGSIMGPILFNLFLNGIVLFIKNSSLTNYADDKTLVDFAKISQEVISHLSKESDVCLDWFSRNGMHANPTKFQLMMNDCKRTKLEPEPTFTLQSTLENEDPVKLLGIKIDRDVTFKEQISNVCRKAGLQLSVLKPLSFILNTNVKMAALHSFIKSHL